MAASLAFPPRDRAMRFWASAAALRDLPQLPYLEMVVKESRRLHPPAIGVFLREALEDVEIGGYPMRRGDVVQSISFVVQRDPRWFPDPTTFDPERFSPERAAALPPFAYFPFGGGPRMCIGYHFSTVEIRLATVALVQRFDLSLAQDQRDVELVPHMSLRPKGGLRLAMCRLAATG